MSRISLYTYKESRKLLIIMLGITTTESFSSFFLQKKNFFFFTYMTKIIYFIRIEKDGRL